MLTVEEIEMIEKWELITYFREAPVDFRSKMKRNILLAKLEDMKTRAYKRKKIT